MSFLTIIYKVLEICFYKQHNTKIKSQRCVQWLKEYYLATLSFLLFIYKTVIMQYIVICPGAEKKYFPACLTMLLWGSEKNK